jgi:hypothetical protein
MMPIEAFRPAPPGTPPNTPAAMPNGVPASERLLNSAATDIATEAVTGTSAAANLERCPELAFTAEQHGARSIAPRLYATSCAVLRGAVGSTP